MRYKIAIILFFVMISASGQDLPDLSNYQHNWLIFNPAFAGSRDVLSVSAFSRDNAILNSATPAPKYFQLSMHTPFKNSSRNAWGISYYNEKEPGLGYLGIIGAEPVPMVDHAITGYYAHKVKMGGGQLSLGMSAIVSVERIDNSEIVSRQPSDPLFLVDMEPVWKANFGAGVLYYTDDFFIAGSVPRLLSPIELLNNNPVTANPDTSGLGIVPIDIGPDYLNYNIMVTTGKQFELNNFITLYPSLLAGYIPSTGISNINYMASFNIGLLEERVWLGAIYKSAKEISVNFNFEMFDSSILLGLSWDFPLASTTGYFDNAFEIILRWDNLTKVVTKAPFYF